jgi:hypothetical protein
MICRECGLDKTYMLSASIGKRKDTSTGRRKIYLDDQGRQWNGQQCPTCKSGAISKKVNTGRMCRCGRPMEKSRYFSCLTCKPVLESDTGWTMPW